MKAGDRVMRRPGTLGATGQCGTVEAVERRDGHTLVTVRFERRTETFVRDTYVPADYERSGTEMMGTKGT